MSEDLSGSPLTPTGHEVADVRDSAPVAAITGAILAAFVAADPFDVTHRFRWAQDVDYLAITLWIAAVLAFMSSVAPIQLGGRRVRTPLQRFKIGMLLALLAGSVTIVSFILTGLHVSQDTDVVAMS